MRLIDKDALLKELGVTDEDCEKCAWGDGRGYCTRGSDFTDACDAICTALTIEERKTGRWIRTDKTDIVDGKYINWAKWNCSECGVEKKIGWAKGVNFCPNCGARMGEEEDG